MRWESGKPAFGFPVFHPLRRQACVECGNRGAISKECGKRGLLSISPSFPEAPGFWNILHSDKRICESPEVLVARGVCFTVSDRFDLTTARTRYISRVLNSYRAPSQTISKIADFRSRQARPGI